MNKKPMNSWYDEYLQISLLKLAQIAASRRISPEELKNYFDDLMKRLKEMEQLDQKDQLRSEENALS